MLVGGPEYNDVADGQGVLARLVCLRIPMECKAGHCLANLPSLLVKQLAGAFGPLGLEAKAITGKAREHVQVEVKNFLEGRFAVGDERVHSLATQAALAHCAC
jgi:hypothetical protein